MSIITVSGQIKTVLFRLHIAQLFLKFGPKNIVYTNESSSVLFEQICLKCINKWLIRM